MSKRILFLTNMGPNDKNPYQGKFVFRQAEALSDALPEGDSVQVFSMPSWLGTKPSWFKYPLWFSWFLLTQSWRRYTHLHVHFFMPTAILAVAFKKFHPRARLYATFHGTDVYAYVPPSNRYVTLMAYFEHFIFVSEKLKKRLTDYVTDDRMMVLPAGIPDLFYPPEKNEPRPVMFLFVGNLNYNKGGDRLLELANQLAPTETLVVAGEGEYKAALQDVAKRKTHIKIVGAQTSEQLRKWYQQSQWVINFSRNESFGLAMTEGMACGTPVLATKTDGAEEQLEQGVNGMLIDPRQMNILDVSRNIDSNAWQSMSQQSVTRVAKYKLSVIAQRLMKLYSDNSNSEKS